MAISHRHKFIFIHIPKCGGSSIENSLSKFTKLDLMNNPRPLSDEQIESRNLYVTGSLHRLARHLSAREIKALMKDQKFQDYYKFSIVRNPYSRLVSYYNFIRQLKSPDRKKLQVRLVLDSDNFKDFVVNALQVEEINLFFNQHKYIFDEDENNLMDFIGKFENLSSDFEQIIQTIRSKENFLFQIFRSLIASNNPSLPHINASKSANYKQYYDDELREKVEQACRKDLDLFDYHF